MSILGESGMTSSMAADPGASVGGWRGVCLCGAHSLSLRPFSADSSWQDPAHNPSVRHRAPQRKVWIK